MGRKKIKYVILNKKMKKIYFDEDLKKLSKI